jgi:hypothetical protein
MDLFAGTGPNRSINARDCAQRLSRLKEGDLRRRNPGYADPRSCGAAACAQAVDLGAQAVSAAP